MNMPLSAKIGLLFTGAVFSFSPPSLLPGLRGSEVTYVAQSAAAAFNPAKCLMKQIIESTLLHGNISKEYAIARAILLFEKLGLPDPENFGDRYPHQISGGQLQRAMTALALCPQPDLVIFDEPTTALDVTTQIDVLAAIKEAIRDTGVAALYITHDLAIVAQISDDIMVLRNGKTVEYGSTDQIINKPKQTYSKALINVRSIAHKEKAPTKESVLSVEAITGRYGGADNDVLHDVSVNLSPGQTLAIVGESGSGKSTLARVITVLLPPSKGVVQLLLGRFYPRHSSNEAKRTCASCR